MIKKVKFLFNFLRLLIRKYWILLTISTIVGISSFFVFSKIAPLVLDLIPKTRRIGLVGRYTLPTLPSKVSKLISLGLTEILPNGQATSSSLVSSWTVKAEGKEYLFSLKPNIRWQDGEKLTSDQIDYDIEGAKITFQGENLVKISLDAPFSPLPSFLGQPIFKNNRTGLGEYKVKKAKVRGGVFSSLNLVSTKNSKDRISFRFYPNEQDLITALELGEIDEVWEISNISPLDDWNNIEIKTENATNQKYVALFFNTRKDPFSSKRIRQGLAYDIEKPIKSKRALGPISPSSWAYSDNVKTYDFNVQHAKNILEKEDWKAEENFKINLYTLPELLDQAEKIKQGWEKDLSLKTEIHVTNFVPDYNDFDAFLGFGIIPFDPDQYFFWHSTQQGNLTGINNPKIDQLLEKGRKTIDLEERQEIYYDFQKAVSEEVPAVFLYYPPSYTIVRK